MVNKTLIRPAIFWGGTLGGGGRLTSHDCLMFDVYRKYSWRVEASKDAFALLVECVRQGGMIQSAVSWMKWWESPVDASEIRKEKPVDMGSLSCLSHFIAGFYESQVGGFTGFLPPTVRVPQVPLNATPPKPRKGLKHWRGDGPLRIKKVRRIWDEGLCWRFLYSHNMLY